MITHSALYRIQFLNVKQKNYRFVGTQNSLRAQTLTSQAVFA